MALNAKGKELLRELQRSDWLPPFNENLVRLVVEESRLLHEEITTKMKCDIDITLMGWLADQENDTCCGSCYLLKLSTFQDNLEAQPASVHCGLVVNHQCLLRNKRCLIAYVYHRMEKIKALRWETGTIIPSSLAPNLCQREVHFFNQYDQLLTDYMTDFELDLSADLKPPKVLYVEVRVLRDCGEVMTESGVVNLEAHSQHFLRRVDVEQLIRQGLLEQIKR